MPVKTINPYLNFDGTADEAIKLYEKVLGAKANVSRFKDVPDMKVPPGTENRVMHAQLDIGGGVIMISDAMPGMAVAKDSNVHVTLHFDDPAEMTPKFEALAAGGKVDMPLNDTFWGARFGMLTDPFGIHWMFNCDLKKG